MTENLGPERSLRDRIVGGLDRQSINLAPLDRLRSRLDDRPGLHTGCVDSDTYAAECTRRVEADHRCALLRRQVADLEAERDRVADELRDIMNRRDETRTELDQARAAAEMYRIDAEQGRVNFRGAARTVERRTQQRDDARALVVGLLRVLDAAADALDAGVDPARVAEDLRRTVQPHYLGMVQG